MLKKINKRRKTSGSLVRRVAQAFVLAGSVILFGSNAGAEEIHLGEKLQKPANRLSFEDDHIQHPTLETKFSYDFTHPDVLDRENIAEITLATGRGLGALAKVALASGIEDLAEGKKDSPSIRLFSYAVYGLLSFPIQSIISSSGHEWGHFAEDSRYGFDYRFEREGGKLDANPFSTLLVVAQNKFGKRSDPWFAALKPRDRTELYSGKFARYRDDIIARIDAGGLNQQQLTLEKQASLIQAGKGDVFADGPLYLVTAGSTIAYPHNWDDGDIDDYAEYLNKKGRGISKEAIRFGLPLVRFFSGSNIALFSSIGKYLNTGDPSITPFSWNTGSKDGITVFWPEFATYLSNEGPTIKVKGLVKTEEHLFEPSIEQSVVNLTGELGLTYCWNPNLPVKINSSVFVNSSNGIWVDGFIGTRPISLLEKFIGVNLESKFLQSLEFGVGGRYSCGLTFQRERLGKEPLEAEDEYSIQGYLQAGICF